MTIAFWATLGIVTAICLGRWAYLVKRKQRTGQLIIPEPRFARGEGPTDGQ